MHRSACSLLIVCILGCILGFGGDVSAYKFLGVQHVGGKSHNIVATALFKGLVEAGHEVTVLSAYPQKKPMKNYHDLETPIVLKALEERKNQLLSSMNSSVFANVISFHDSFLNITELFLNEPAVQKLLKSDQTFDAVICEVFMGEALYGLSEHFKAPLIGFSTFGAISWNTDMVGSPSPPSYVPNAFLPFTDRMTLTKRVVNLAFLTFERLLLDWYYLPKQEAIYKKYFPHVKRSMYEVRRNTALVLLNTHVSLSFARPYVPNQIEVGGMQINEQRKPLPEHIRKFIEESEHGVVYFSMGSNLQSKNLPLDKRQILLDTFRGLKQRVLWKFEDPKLEGKPDNVLISDWFPQDDILSHPNVRLFITHGGLLSTTESIYHGKPVIGIPMFGDQFINMARAEANGYGIQLNFLQLSRESLKEAIDRVLNEKSFGDIALQMSKRFRDQDMKPLDKAVYWVEHVVRHKGAAYLRNAGQTMNFIQYHNIDAMLLLYGGLLTVLVALVVFVKKLVQIIVYNRRKTSKKVKKH